MTIEIPIQVIDIEDDGCHLIIKAKFNTRHKGFLIIDTGASKSVFDMKQLEPISEIIPHDADSIKSSGITQGFLENKVAVIKKLAIGELILKNYQIILLDLSHINDLYSSFFKYPIWGLLGGDFLKSFKARINYKKGILILEVPKELSAKKK